MDWKIDFLQQIGNRHVMVVGDLMLDKYLWGHVNRISPEAPVPILNLESSHNRLGGAANVALNLANLGCKVSLAGIVGHDTSGQMVKSLLAEAGISDECVISLDRVPTTTKTRVIAGHQHVLRVDDEQFLDLTSSEEDEFLGTITDALENSPPDAVILQDYNKGVLSPRVISGVIQLARDKGIPVTVDPKKDNFNLYSGVAVFKPNLRELAGQFVEEITHDKESLDKAVRALREQMDIELCCVTLSEHGIYISTNTESAIYPTKSRDVVDVCGAGDAVISVLTLAYIHGLSPQQAADLANHAGGAVCGVVGVAPVSKAMLGKELGVETFL